VRANICSAYIRSETFRYLFEDLLSAQTKTRVLTRWALSDLITESSDLATYEICKSNKIAFYIKHDFHGKLYDLTPNGVLIGSFNLTNRGFSISKRGNDEAGVLIENDIDTGAYFETLFASSRLMDDELFEKISNYISKNKALKSSNDSWPEDIFKLITQAPSELNQKILVSECLASSFQEFKESTTEARTHDLSLLCISESEANDLTVLRSSFRDSKIFRWFYAAMRAQEGGCYFGKATAILHDQLFDDPKPYRQEVKGLLANLLSWIDGLELEEIKIDRPNHSQRITIHH
jgi:hypothetical protein